ncbi:MAG: ATP-binding cassette domain-containing protein [Bacteroidota bacterium]|nr:ATP-binding cassette domain-containing protein [Bacteroidota bacterium]
MKEGEIDQEILKTTNEAVSKDPVIEISNVYKSFGDNKVLIDFSLTVHKGENVVVLGKSGSGKSVLIKCVVGLLEQDKGSIKVLGNKISDLGREELDKLRVQIGFLFQNSALYDSMTVRENLEFPMRRHLAHLEKKESDLIVAEALENVGLLNSIDAMPGNLSGGMRKRIGLARTLILKPDIVLYDEPTTGLDPITGREIVELMMDLQKKYNTTSIIISHDMQVAKTTANKVVVLVEGKNYAEGTFDELKNNKDLKVKQFFESLT